MNVRVDKRQVLGSLEAKVIPHLPSSSLTSQLSRSQSLFHSFDYVCRNAFSLFAAHPENFELVQLRVTTTDSRSVNIEM